MATRYSIIQQVIENYAKDAGRKELHCRSQFYLDFAMILCGPNFFAYFQWVAMNGLI